MKTPLHSSSTSHHGISARLALAVAIAATLPAFHAEAVDRIKQNNTTALNLAGSWDTLPTAADVAVWDSTVTAANTVALGADLSFQGIRIANPTGLVTVTYAAGQTLTLGTSGIDLSANLQNLTLMSPAVANTAGTLAIGGNQTWNVAAARTLILFANSNTANQRLSGSGNIEVTGGGIVRLLTGDAGSTTFVAGNGNDTYTGNWTITSGSVRGLRNGTHAWGQGTIFMNGGTLGQEQGNWTWTNNITLNTATTSTFDDFNGSGTNRSLKLQGVLSGDGNINFNDTNNRMDNNNGFVLTGTNTMSGAITVGASGNLRVGGVGGNDGTLGAGTTGTLGTATVNLSAATSNLTFSRSNAHTVSNPISGLGTVQIGGPANSGGQVLTLSGANTYAGATTVSAGRLDLTGTLTSATTVSNGASISGTGSTSGTITFAGGDGIKLAGGGTTTSVTGNGVTFSAATTASFLTSPVAATTYDVITYGAGTVTNPGSLSVNAHGTLTNTGTKFTFLADGAQTRTWDGVTGSWVIGGVTDLWQEGDQKFYNGDNVIFNEPAAAATVSIPSAVTVGSISIANTTNAYTFDGAAAIGGTGGLSKTGAGAVTFSNNGHSYTGNVTISGGTVNTGATQGGGTNGYLGAINGSRTITIQNTGTVVNFNANNQFGGSGKTAATIPNVAIDGATLNSTRFNILGNVTLTNGAALTQSSTDSGAYDGYEFIGGTVTVSGTGASTVSTGNGSENHLAGGLTTIFNVANTTGDSAADLIVSAGLRDGSGDFSGAGALTKTGAGTMALTATNTYTGTTSVNAGTLLVNGSISGSTVTVDGTGILGGSGGTTGAVNVNAGGMLAPGASIGTLNTGALSLGAGSTFALQIDTTATTTDLAAVTGGLSLSLTNDALLTIADLAATPITTGTFTFITYTGTWNGGLFNYGGNAIPDDGLLTVGGNQFTLDYNAGGNSVALLGVPEPTAAVSLLGGLGLLLGLRRRRSGSGVSATARR